MSQDSPLPAQVNAIKAKHPDCILWHGVNDFYEAFGQDAIDTANTLGTVLTMTNDGRCLTGFPRLSLDNYLPKMVRSGRKVGIVDQLETTAKNLGYKRKLCK